MEEDCCDRACRGKLKSGGRGTSMGTKSSEPRQKGLDFCTGSK